MEILLVKWKSIFPKKKKRGGHAAAAAAAASRGCFYVIFFWKHDPKLHFVGHFVRMITIINKSM